MSKKGAAVAGGALGLLRFTIPAGKAAPAPPIGPALGQRGINIMDFCKQFNERTKTYVPETPIPTEVQYNPKDRSFTFKTRSPPVPHFLKLAAGVEKGSTGRDVVGTVTIQQVYEIAQIKKTDYNLAHIPLESICASIVGTARSMGIQVVKAEAQ